MAIEKQKVNRLRSRPITRAGYAGALSALVIPAAAFLAFTSFENSPGIIQLAAVGISALVAGIVEGLLVERSCLDAIGWGTFAGSLVLWSPVVIATYGFALLGLPILAGLAALVWFGAKLACSLRGRSATQA
jgi:hypothetical protein